MVYSVPNKIIGSLRAHFSKQLPTWHLIHTFIRTSIQWKYIEFENINERIITYPNLTVSSTLKLWADVFEPNTHIHLLVMLTWQPFI
uniref:Uncharacterized protein n=1 Tax=Pyxicephalus adspersus TaxID=30357 RepID=A0AAV3AUZ4_PYXAD|nr:TPA: hypothetical protein GDO54_007341 [Pyxicephalus adspersus]